MNISTKPKLEDFYIDDGDPRGISTSEHESMIKAYEDALKNYKSSSNKDEINESIISGKTLK